MKDLHTHLCFNIDDGSKSIEESIFLIKKMSEEGITDIFLTPHYMKDTLYNADNKIKRNIYNTLVDKCKENNIKVNLYLGNEIYIDDDIDRLIRSNKIETLNNTNYILVEFSLFQYNSNYKLIIHNLLTKGYKVILAHPERYIFIDKKMELIEELLEMGVLLQGNYLSLFDKYGIDSKKQLIRMLKKKYITFLGSDIHHDEKLYLNKLEHKLLRITKDKEYVKDLLYRNVDKYLLKQN